MRAWISKAITWQLPIGVAIGAILATLGGAFDRPASCPPPVAATAAVPMVMPAWALRSVPKRVRRPKVTVLPDYPRRPGVVERNFRMADVPAMLQRP